MMGRWGTLSDGEVKVRGRDRTGLLLLVLEASWTE